MAPADNGASRPDDPILTGIIGLGRVGSIHAKLLAHHLIGAQLTAVCDNDEATGARFAASVGARFTSSAAELIAGDLDAVLVCTTTDSHPALVAESIAAGHAVLCEKPLTLDPAEAAGLGRAAEAEGTVLQVGFNRRFDPPTGLLASCTCCGSLAATPPRRRGPTPRSRAGFSWT